MDDREAEREAWIALAAVDGVGEQLMSRLVGRYGGAAAVLEAARHGRLAGAVADDDGGVRSIPRVVRGRIAEMAVDPAAIARRIAGLGVWTLTPFDASYPRRFDVLDPPPPVIYGWGDPAVLDAPRSVAVVGTRRPTPGGRALAASVAARLAGAAVSVVSGLAIGIDGVAHAAAVEAGGRSVGVIGAGHAQPGPRTHRGLLAALIATGGAVVGELAPDATPTRGTFPRRNRLISALSDAVIVIEAPVGSGALITARHAHEQGRAVFAAPGRPGDPATAGCLALLRETPARPLVGPDELLADLGVGPETALDQPGATAVSAQTVGPLLASLAEPERAVARHLARSPATADRLVALTDLPPGEVAAALTLLQLRGWVRPSGSTFLAQGPLLRVG